MTEEEYLKGIELQEYIRECRFVLNNIDHRKIQPDMWFIYKLLNKVQNSFSRKTKKSLTDIISSCTAMQVEMMNGNRLADKIVKLIKDYYTERLDEFEKEFAEI